MSLLRFQSIANPQSMCRDILSGYIRIGYRNDNHHVILCYTSKTQITGHWVNDTTLIARGLVLSVKDANKLETAVNRNDSNECLEQLENAIVVARGMKKFFTVEASTSDWGKTKLVDDDENVTINNHAVIDWDSPASVSDKLDGALGIGVIVNDDGHKDMIITTKGSFTSDEALAGTAYLHDNHDVKAFVNLMLSKLDGLTPLFEIIMPGSNHIVNYGSLADACFLGFVDNITGEWIPAALIDYDQRTQHAITLDKMTHEFGFKVPEVYQARNLMEALLMPSIDNHEGMVVTISKNEADMTPQRMFKIKYPSFLMLQRLRNEMLSDKCIKAIIRNMPVAVILDSDKNIDSFANLSVETRKQVNNLIEEGNEKVERYVEEIRNDALEAQARFVSLSDSYDVLENRHNEKAFAIALENEKACIKKAVFALKSDWKKNNEKPSQERMNEISVNIIRQQILK